MSAWKCCPSPATSTCSQARPASMLALMLSANTMSDPQLVARAQQSQGCERYDNQARRDHPEAQHGRDVGDAEESVAEAVHHVEEGIGTRQAPPELGQRVDGVEHARKHGRRKNHEVLEHRQLVDLVRPDS